ncbi:MAG: DUF3299 domain-containing protein [Pseudomonadota bacterium]
MKRLLALACLLLATTVTAADYKVGDRLVPAKSTAAAKAREISWDDLLPRGWNPAKEIESLKLDKLSDSDPRAMEALDKLKTMWNNAPPNPDIAGKPIRIPGFMVPLEYGKKEVKEFLLVPYFGACIHVPPPPANQIIHVVASKPVKTEGYMDAVWIEGTLELAVSKTDMGDSGYRMRAAKVSPYKAPR